MRLYCLSLIIVALGCSTIAAQGLSSYSENSENVKVLELLSQIAVDDQKRGLDHCEVPCGIYGDSLRVSLIKEHSSTIEKAMNQINELSKAESPNYNQLIRWVTNKEKHAEEIQHIVSQYFMHQRIKLPGANLSNKEFMMVNEKYTKLLSNLHAIQVYAMKCKQSTDLNLVGNLNTSISNFEDNYFHTHDH